MNDMAGIFEYMPETQANVVSNDTRFFKAMQGL